MAQQHRFPKDSENALLTLTCEQQPSSSGPPTPVWVIELHNGVDNRLSHDLIDKCLKPALDTVEREWRDIWRKAEAGRAKAKKEKRPERSEDKSSLDGSGALIIIGRRSQDKFFSNGLDYINAIADPNFFSHTLNPLLARLLTFPMPVIAALNGHTFAAGLMLAFSCDYRIMVDGSKRNAWTCMNEVHFGAPWPPSFAAITNAKISSPLTIRRLALEGARFTPQESLEHGIVDEIVPRGSEGVFDAAKKLAVKVAPGAKTGVYGRIKFDLYRQTLKAVSKDYRQIFPSADDAVARSRL